MGDNVFKPENGIFCAIDLEETIIRSWDDPILINVQRIKEFLQKRSISEINIFSYAIYDDKDKHVFANDVKPCIERALGVSVLSWPSVQDIIREEKKFNNVIFDPHYEVSEYIQLRGKKDGFINYVQSKYDFDLAILIDDVIPDITVTHRTNGWSIELWNVNSI